MITSFSLLPPSSTGEQSHCSDGESGGAGIVKSVSPFLAVADKYILLDKNTPTLTVRSSGWEFLAPRLQPEGAPAAFPCKHFRSGHCSWVRGLTGLPGSRRGRRRLGLPLGKQQPRPGSRAGILFISSSPYRAEVRARYLAQGPAVHRQGWGTTPRSLQLPPHARMRPLAPRHRG